MLRMNFPADEFPADLKAGLVDPKEILPSQSTSRKL
jgi:hypothetical protein